MCGVVGIWGTPEAAKEAYLGLLTLQHRGQDGAGILSYHHQSFHLKKGSGLVSQALDSDLSDLPGKMAIGHTRYQTTGVSSEKDLQPMVFNYPFGVGMAHNGNVVNYHQLSDDLRNKKKRVPLTSSDLEVLLHLLAENLDQKEEITQAISHIFSQAKGGYSVVGILAPGVVFAFRDPQALRPLIFGTKDVKEGKSYCVASESCALDFLGYNIERNLNPGELVLFSDKGQQSFQVVETPKASYCMFEWVYFSNPESILEEKSVYQVRSNLGKKLAQKVKRFQAEKRVKPDIIVPVPDTSRIAAVSLAQELGLPYCEALVKSRYVQRSFILKNQGERRSAVELKLTPVKSALKGKNVLLLDDSIVRGTTSKRIIELVKRAGAKEVSFASTCPPLRHPCYFGIDFPSPDELVANQRKVPEIATALGASEVIYLDIEDLGEAIGLSDLCQACLTGEYPVSLGEESERFSLEREKGRTLEAP